MITSRHERPRRRAVGWAALAVLVVVAGLVLLAAQTLGEPCGAPSCRPAGATAATEPAAAASSTEPEPAQPELAAYTGSGTWVSRYRSSPAFAGDDPPITPTDVDSLAAAAVDVLYLQAAVDDPQYPGLLDPDLLGEFLTRAHARDMAVVAWYLPHFTDVAADLRRLQAMVDFRASGHAFDAVAVDVEDRSVTDVDLRNARLVDLSARLAAANPGVAIGAIVLPPVVTDVLAPDYWPRFPWREIAPHYDVWLPMAYWSNRKVPPWNDAYRYTSENIRRLRMDLGQPCAPVSAIGGFGETVTAADYAAMARAAADERAIGVSIFDWTTTPATAWPELRGYDVEGC